MIASRHRRLAGAWIAIGLCSLCLVTAGGGMTTTDAVVAYDVTRNLVEHQTVATSKDWLGTEAYRGRDGRYYSPFGIAQSVWNIPFFVVGRAIAERSAVWNGSDMLPKAAVALATVPAVALLAWVGFELLMALGLAPLRAAVWSVLLVVATPLWPYSRFGFNQPLTALFLWASVLCAVNGRAPSENQGRWLMICGLCAGLTVLTRHEMAAATVIIGVFIAMQTRSRAAMQWYLAGLLPTLAVWGALNWWRFGNPLETGYLRDTTPGFGGSIISGLTGLLFSPSASIFIYCPLTVASVVGLRAMARPHRAVAALFIALGVVYLLFYASLGNWIGGRSYGPRYLVTLLPALVLPLAFWRPATRVARLTASALIMLSVGIQLPGVLVDYSKVRMSRAMESGTMSHDLAWSESPLVLNARTAIANAPSVLAHLTHTEAVPRITMRELASPTGLPFGFDFWWLYLVYAGVIGTGTALAIAVGLSAAGAGAIWRGIALTREQPMRGAA
jgi:hypothetical protein